MSGHTERGMAFEVMSVPCNQCLLSKIPIVSKARIRSILRDCRQKDMSFFCHKASMNNRKIACRAHFDTGVGQLARIAGRLGAIVEIDPETLSEQQ